MNNILFYHHNPTIHGKHYAKDRMTYAFQMGKSFCNFYHFIHEITNKVNSDMGIDNLFVDIKVGIAYVHPKDRYNKKTGREVAEKALALTPSEKFKVEAIRFDGRGVLINLKAAEYLDKSDSSMALGPVYDLVLKFTKNKKILIFPNNSHGYKELW